MAEDTDSGAKRTVIPEQSGQFFVISGMGMHINPELIKKNVAKLDNYTILNLLEHYKGGSDG